MLTPQLSASRKPRFRCVRTQSSGRTYTYSSVCVVVMAVSTQPASPQRMSILCSTCSTYVLLSPVAGEVQPDRFAVQLPSN